MPPFIQNAIVGWRPWLTGVVQFVLLNGVVLWDYLSTHDWHRGHWAVSLIGLALLIQGLLTGTAQEYQAKLAHTAALKK